MLFCPKLCFHHAGNIAAAHSKPLSSKNQRNKCFSSGLRSRMPLFLPKMGKNSRIRLKTELLYGYLGSFCLCPSSGHAPSPPSAVSGDCGMVRDYRRTAPCQCPQATDCIRVGGFIKRCSGVGTASALSKEIVPGSHTVALPLLSLHSSRVGPWLSSLVHNHH